MERGAGVRMVLAALPACSICCLSRTSLSLTLHLPAPSLHIYQHQCISHTGQTYASIYNLKGFLTLSRLALR